MADPAIPTFASGTFCIISGTSVFDLENDSARAGGANGYQNQDPAQTAGSFNAQWNNGVLSPRTPVAGVNGNQS